MITLVKLMKKMIYYRSYNTTIHDFLFRTMYTVVGRHVFVSHKMRRTHTHKSQSQSLDFWKWLQSKETRLSDLFGSLSVCYLSDKKIVCRRRETLEWSFKILKRTKKKKQLVCSLDRRVLRTTNDIMPFGTEEKNNKKLKKKQKKTASALIRTTLSSLSSTKDSWKSTVCLRSSTTAAVAWKPLRFELQNGQRWLTPWGKVGRTEAAIKRRNSLVFFVSIRGPSVVRVRRPWIYY